MNPTGFCVHSIIGTSTLIRISFAVGPSKKRLCPSVWVCGELKFVALLPCRQENKTITLLRANQGELWDAEQRD